MKAELQQLVSQALEQLEPAVADGLVVVEADGSFAVTSLGRLLVRNVAMVFDAYLETKPPEASIFSRTV